MTNIADLKKAIVNLVDLPATKARLQLNSNTSERAFEAYVLGLCMKAVRNQGGTAVITGISNGPKPKKVVFRGGPGSMYSKSQDFCYAACELKRRRFELHVDVEYLGQSGASHEIDVSMYDADAADEVRRSKRMPKTSKPLIMVFECKYYTGAPGVGLGRSFVGLVSDCVSNKLNAFVANRSADNLERYLCRPSTLEPFTDLSPLSPDSEDRFVRCIEQVLRKWVYTR